MPRPIETLNSWLAELCIEKGTFKNIFNLPDGNLWYATNGQLADAVDRGLQDLQKTHPDIFQKINSAIVSHEDALRKRLLKSDVGNTALRFTFSDREKRALVAKDFVDGPDDSEQWEELPVSCIICYEGSHIKLPSCGCHYCYECFRKSLRDGLASDSTFPPGCCDVLRPDEALLAKRPSLFHLYRQLGQEYKYPSTKRIYCADTQCGTFVGIRDPNAQRLKCRVCDAYTCAVCCTQDHPGKPCPWKEEPEDLWASMDATGSVNCPRCGEFYTHGGGCNYLTCKRCPTLFCHLCGAIDSDGTENNPPCKCPPYGELERRVPMARRKGPKPERFRKQVIEQAAPVSDRYPPELSVGEPVMHEQHIMLRLQNEGLYRVPEAYA